MVASLAGSDEVLSDVLYVTESAGVGDFGRLVALMASPYTAPLDKTRPTGVVLTLQGENDMRALSFVPVKDLKMLLMTMEEQIGKPEDLGGGVLKVAGDRPQPMFVKEVGRLGLCRQPPRAPERSAERSGRPPGRPEQEVHVGPAGERLQHSRRTARDGRDAAAAGFEDRVAQELNAQQAEAMREVGRAGGRFHRPTDSGNRSRHPGLAG